MAQDDLFTFFIEQTNEVLKEIKEDQRSMSRKIDSLFEFKWKIIGGSVALSSFVAIAIELISLKLH